MTKEIISRCGYRCDLCLAYRDNVEKDDRRNLLSDGWYKYYGFRVEPENIVCDGCLKDDCTESKLLDTDCLIRPCVKENGYENCSQCDEFICEKYKQRLIDFEEIKKQFGNVSRTDYKLFINPYENGKRISELKQENSEKQRMYNKEIIPDINAMSKFIGGECSAIWDVIYFDEMQEAAGNKKTVNDIVKKGYLNHDRISVRSYLRIKQY